MLLGRVHPAKALADLQRRTVNYDPTPRQPHTSFQGFHVDATRTTLATEAPGPPIPGGAWEIACALVRDYQFVDPSILRGCYRAGAELLGRDMLLEGHFLVLRFLMGVRVTAVVDEQRQRDGSTEQVWGWTYQTLEGHLEEGELTYEVVKDLDTGVVEFVIHGYSRRASIRNPVVRLGFALFGRWTQVRFYRACGPRLRRLVEAMVAGTVPPPERPEADADGLVLAPTVAPPG